MTATLVLVHGSLGGSWTWQELIRELGVRNVAAVAVDLPSHVLKDPSIDFRDDARQVRGVIDAIDGPVVLVGSSYGGYVITEAANAQPSVIRLVYVAALMLDEGQPFIDGLGGNSAELMSALRFTNEGLIETDGDAVVGFAAHLAPESVKQLVRERAGGPMSMGTDPMAALTGAAWKTIPSTYVICSEDRSVRPDFQREMATGRATEVVEMPWDHWPQHSHPSELADLLEKLARLG